MTNIRNNAGFVAKNEFGKGRGAVLDSLGPLFPEEISAFGPNVIFPLANTFPTVTSPEAPRDTLKTSDLIFCEKPEFFVETEDCESCIKNPLAFVPDWRATEPNTTFFDGRKCRYSAVVDTGAEGIPEVDSPEYINAISNGVLALLEAYGKSGITTTVYYIFNDPAAPIEQDPTQLIEGQEEREIVYSVGDYENVGAPLDYLFQSGTDLTSVSLPPRKKGFVRLLIENSTVDILTKTNDKFNQPAITVEFHVPRIPKLSENKVLPTLALISVDAEVFRRIPENIVTEPAILGELLDGVTETTLNGRNLRENFRLVSENLQRANLFATNAIKGVDQSRFFYTDRQTEIPVIFDFEQEAAELLNFRNNILIPAVQSALGIRIRDLDKVRLTFERDAETDNLKITEAVGNAVGCAEFSFSELNGRVSDVTALFNYDRITTLGYVAALPDMLYYIQGTLGIVWLEFITQFTYPRVEFRTPVDLVTFEDDRSLGECAAQKSGLDLVNKVLDNVLGTPDLLLDGLTQSICKAAGDVLRGARTEADVLAEKQRNDIAIIEQQIKQKKQELLDLQSQPTNPALATKIRFLRRQIEALQQESNDIQNQSTRELVNDEIRENFIKDIERKIKNGGRNISSRPLVRVLVVAMLFGLEQALKDEEDRAINKRPQFKVFEIEEVQKAIDQTLGGWCGYTSLVLQALQCLLNGLGVDDLKQTIVDSLLKSLRPDQVQNFLRSLGIRDPDRLRAFDAKFRQVTGKALNEVLTPLSGISIDSTFNYAREYDKQYAAAFSAQYPNTPLENDTVSQVVKDNIRRQAVNTVNRTRSAQIERGQALSGRSDITELLPDALNLATDLLPEGTNVALDTLIGGEIKTTSQLTDLVAGILKDIFSIDELFDFLSEAVPGFNVLQGAIADFECLVPALPDLNPPIGLNLKTLNLDLCALSPTKGFDFTFPRINPPDPILTKTDIKNFFIILGQYLRDLLIDIATQLLIKLLVSIIESVLDLACDLIATAGASIADAFTGNDKFKEELREALCPNEELTDQQFANAMINVFGALSNSRTGQDCVENLTAQDMADFIDSILVSISYNELYNLLLGTANPNTYTLISRIAEISDSECIADIFSNEDNVADYFGGLGALIDAQGTFNSFPPDVYLQDNLNVCPPDAQDVVRQIQANLLRDQGLSSQQINDQIEYAKERAQEKMQSLITSLVEGPYGDLPSLLASDECPDNGLLRRDPAIATSLQVGTDATMESIENAALRDLIGVRGLLPRILSDSEGNGLRTHRFLTRGIFGNPVGRNNTFIQFYSDDALVPSRQSIFNIVEQNRRSVQLVDGVVEEEKYPKTPAIIEPIGGFPLTVGGYLHYKLANYEIGIDVDNDDEQDVLIFATRMRDITIDLKNEEIAEANSQLVKERIFFVAKWALATYFVDYNTLLPFLDGSILGEEFVLKVSDKFIELSNKQAQSYYYGEFAGAPKLGKRIGIFNELIQACNKRVFSESFRDFSAERRVKRILSNVGANKNISVNITILGLSFPDINNLKKKKFDDLGDSTNNYWNTNIGRSFKTTGDHRELYLELADTKDDRELERAITNNPYELALEFTPYRLRNQKNEDKDPDIKISVSYDVNPQDFDPETQTISFLEDKYKYRFIYSNTYNPFGTTFDEPALNIEAALTEPEQEGDSDSGFTPADFGTILPPPSSAQDIVYEADISSIPDAEVVSYVDQYLRNIGPDEVSYSYVTEFLRKWFNAQVTDKNIRFNSTMIPQTEPLVVFYDAVNQGFFRRVSRKIAYTLDGQITDGFKFGYDVLNQPQAITLDPAKYGGTELNPPFYLEPPDYDGWLGVLQKFIPQEDGCVPRRIPLYDMRDIPLASNELYARLQRDERLNFQPLCTKEAPYNSIRDRATIISLENMIRATTRVYITDFIVKVIPVLSQFSLNLEGNFDDLIELYLGSYVLGRVSEAGVTRPTRKIVADNDNNIFVSGEVVARNKYYLNFLEAATSNILSKIDSGILKEEDLNEEQKQALAQIRATIDEYYIRYAGTEAILSEEAIQTQDIIKRSISPIPNDESSLGRGSAKFDKLRAKRIKVGLLYETLAETEEFAKILFSLYVKEEFDALRERIDAALEPEVDDLGLLMLSDPLFMNGHIRKRSFERGVAFPETEDSPSTDEDQTQQLVFVSRPDNTIEYELPYDVPYFEEGVLKTNIVEYVYPEDTSFSDDELFKWPLVLEKYIRIEDREVQVSSGLSQLGDVRDSRLNFEEVDNRPESLRDIVRLTDWIEYLETLDDVVKTKKISDVWNNWFFGLRLSVIVDPSDVALGAALEKAGLDPNGIGKRVVDADGNERIIVPIANGELEVPDQIIGETTTFTDVVGDIQEYELLRQYDTLCLVNELVKTPEYKTFFEYVFPLKRYLSILTIYISNAFYLSIGNTGPINPEEGDKEGPGDLWAVPSGRPLSGFRLWDKNAGNFNRSERMLRSMFMNTYNTLNKTISRTSKDRVKNNQSLKQILSDLIPDAALAGMPWWQRRMRVDKPFDLFDGECEDEEDYF